MVQRILVPAMSASAKQKSQLLVGGIVLIVGMLVRPLLGQALLAQSNQTTNTESRGTISFSVAGNGVKKNGWFTNETKLTLTDAIKAAGGFSIAADKENIELFRTNSGTPIIINMLKVEAGQAEDLLVWDNDRIQVPMVVRVIKSNWYKQLDQKKSPQ